MKKIWEWLSGNVIREVGKVIDDLTTTEEEKLEAQKKIVQILEEADKQAQEEITARIDSTNLSFIQNNNWSNGMGTSIAKTIPVLQDFHLEFDGLLIAACDQPLISVDHYKKLINSCINRDRIIASSYGEGVGIPVVFDNSYFMELSGLQKDVGAKSIIHQHLQHLITLDAPEGLIDLDTRESYEKYYQTHGRDI